MQEHPESSLASNSSCTANDARLNAVVWLVGCLAYGLLRLLMLTWRYRWKEDDEQLEATRSGSCIYVLFHGNQLPLLGPFRGKTRTILISRSRDGQLLTEVARRLGYSVIRGSSSRDGSKALHQLERLTMDGYSPVLAVDGPRGPAGLVKGGAIRLAAATGLPILPVSINAPGLRLKTWDRFLIPFPFATVTVRRGTPLYIRQEEALVASMRTALAAQLTKLEIANNEKGRPGTLISLDNDIRTRRSLYPPLQRVLSLVEPSCLELLRIYFRWISGKKEHLIRLEPGPTPPPGCIWIHAASIGEIRIAWQVEALLLERFPTIPVALTTTSTRALELAQRFGRMNVTLLPLDFPRLMHRHFDRWRARALLLVETELWPTLLWEAHQRRMCVALINARMSKRTFRRYFRWRLLFSPMLNQVTILSRTATDGDRFAALVHGGPAVSRGKAAHASIRTLGDLKLLEGAPSRTIHPELQRWMDNRPILVYASVHPGEVDALKETIVALELRCPAIAQLIAPRYPDTISCNAWLNSLARRSRLLSRNNAISATLLVLDTLGELSGILSHAIIAVMGGTFLPIGGHNLYEPAFGGSYTVVGPYIDNIRHQCEELYTTGACERVENGGRALLDRLRQLLEHASVTRAQGQEAKRHVMEQKYHIRQKFIYELNNLINQPWKENAP